MMEETTETANRVEGSFVNTEMNDVQKITSEPNLDNFRIVRATPKRRSEAAKTSDNISDTNQRNKIGQTPLKSWLRLKTSAVDLDS